jgi:hypothetical protein
VGGCLIVLIRRFVSCIVAGKLDISLLFWLLQVAGAQLAGWLAWKEKV